MKRSILKTLTFVAALCVAAPMLSTAADAPEGKRGKMGGRLDEVLGKLDLTADQKAKVDAAKAKMAEYMKAHAEELKAAREATDPEKKQAAMKGMMEQMKQLRESITAVLTDEQKKKFAELMPARGPGQGQGKRGNKQ